MDRQIDRQIYKQTKLQKDKKIENQTDRLKERETDRKIRRQFNKVQQNCCSLLFYRQRWEFSTNIISLKINLIKLKNIFQLELVEVKNTKYFLN